MSILFTYSADVLEKFPLLSGGVLKIDLVAPVDAEGLASAYATEQGRVRAELGDRSLSDLPPLAGWRAAFRAFGVDPTQYRSAAESLLRRLTKKGDISSINPLVDMGNLVSIRHALPVAVIDLDRVLPPISVRFAEGVEPFHDLGESETIHPQRGEVIFVDAAGQVHARRWCWRQSMGSAASLQTRLALITIEAQHANGAADVRAAMEDMRHLVQTFANGRIQSALLAGAQSAFDAL